MPARNCFITNCVLSYFHENTRITLIIESFTYCFSFSLLFADNKWTDVAPYRSFILSCFRKFGIGTSRFEEPITAESTCLIEELANVKDKPVDLKWYLNNAVSNIISKVVFGTRFEFTDERIHHLTNLLNRENELAGPGGLELFVPASMSKKKQELNKVLDELLKFINEMMESHRSNNFDPNNLNDIIDMWLNEIRLKRSDDPNSYLNPENMAGQIHLLFLAGTDTTSNTLRWATQYLVKYPEVQARIHSELDTIIGRNRLPKLTDKQNLPYIEAVLMGVTSNTINKSARSLSRSKWQHEFP